MACRAHTMACMTHWTPLPYTTQVWRDSIRHVIPTGKSSLAYEQHNTFDTVVARILS